MLTKQEWDEQLAEEDAAQEQLERECLESIVDTSIFKKFLFSL